MLSSFNEKPFCDIRMGRISHIDNPIPLKLSGPSLSGFPLLAEAEIGHFQPAEPPSGGDRPYPGCPEEIEFIIHLFNIRGNRVRWLEQKLTAADWAEIEQDIKQYFENLAAESRLEAMENQAEWEPYR